MANSILICLITSLSCGFLLNVGLVYIDARLLRKDRYKWETAVTLIIGICQAGLSIAGIIATSIALNGKAEPYWLDAVFLCNLQLSVGTNFARKLCVIEALKQLIWISHAITVLTAPDIFSCTKDKNLCFFNEPALLSRVSVASLISLALCHHYLQLHKIAGARRERNSGYIRLMKIWIIANGAAALCQLVGEIIYYSLSHARKHMSTNLRRGIFLACLFAQLLNSFGFFIKGIEERMARVSSSRSTRNRNSDVEGAVRLNSL